MEVASVRVDKYDHGKEPPLNGFPLIYRYQAALLDRVPSNDGQYDPDSKDNPRTWLQVETHLTRQNQTMRRA
jgi:hypothetical protein